uniref:Ubiquitin-like domain-containing protein n=1 Tax=Anopheles epiroticus TaxID=199890 RepID=A0A182PQ83_9DIPT
MDPVLSSIIQVDEFVYQLLATLESGSEGTSFNTKSTAFGKESAVLANLALELLSVQHQHGCEIAFNKNFTHVELSNFDHKGNHSLSLSRTGEELFKVAKHTLPELAVSELFKRQTTLQRHVQVFLDLIDQLEEFYNNLNTIDELCYVILPASIDTKTVYRIFKYDRKVFLKISLHPLLPAAVDIGFFGPTKQVAKLREIYNEKQDDWDPECNVYTNLLRIFNIIAFPMRPPVDESQQVQLGEDSCGICMNYRDTAERVPISLDCDDEPTSSQPIFQSRRVTRSSGAIEAGPQSNVISLDSDDEPEAVVRQSSGANASFEAENYEMRIKVKWGLGVETFIHRRYQKFADIIDQLAAKASADSECIFLNLKDRIVYPCDTPDSIDYESHQFISGRVLRNKAPTLPATHGPSSAGNSNMITLKVQLEKRKQPLRLQIDKNQTMSVLVIKCAEELKCEPKAIRLYFDGDMVDNTSKPADLELEGDEMLDCRFVK